MNRFLKIGLIAALPLALALVVPAQAKKNRKTGKAAKPATENTVPQPVAPPPAPTEESHKRNERPNTQQAKSAATQTAQSAYSYEFTRPGFVYSRVVIEHDDAGTGKISFQKNGFEEVITDPVSLSSVTMRNIKDALVALDFFASTEEYQTARDYSHMGNSQFTFRRDGKTRTVKYNWTENKSAKILMDEYRRLANEYTWRFEISVGRENQPLETPGQMDVIDSYIQRGEISDPPHLLPFLTELSTDERMPLMARNHALKLIKQIEKKKK